MMATYITEQTVINDRRMKEMEQQIQTINATETQSVVASPPIEIQSVVASSPTELSAEQSQPIAINEPTPITT